MFHFGLTPTIDKPTPFTCHTASMIDHVITHSIKHTGFKLGTIKTDMSNNLLIFFCYKYIVEKEDARSRC